MENNDSVHQRKILLFIQVAAICLIGIVAFMFMIIAITPLPVISALQKGKMDGEINSYQPKSAPIEKTLSDGTTYISEIAYGENYPNSYLDLYLTKDDTETCPPTFFYVHGGAYAWGDKVEGDPLADNSQGYLRRLVKNGFNVVSMDYALTPDYLYPTPIYQIDQAINFLQQSSHQYGLDMDTIVFAGASAGGQLVGQYVNIQTNPNYAESMGMSPSLTKEAIKAVIFNSALLDASRFDKTGNLLKDIKFRFLGELYFDTDDLKNSDQVEQSNVITHMNSDFPPSFITDGNTATFTDQAEDLANHMTELSIPHVLNLYDKNEAELRHRYERSLNNKYAKENFEKMLKFLNTYVE
ncbi:alpha/beta hydrolase [Aquibacillus sediminis]|uniref:alpha/beta hydrolase n=1 Tax=Aquibacillus sediminis TaxID=2574734 RepID=UPI0011081D1E|nr:alpha/beta hydrolase [Aquibacillus sediminis]